MTLQEQIRSNRVRSIIVMLGFGMLVAAIGFAASYAYDPSVLGIIGIVGIVYGLISYFNAGKMIARASGAIPISKAQAPALYRAVENAAIGAGLARTPDVYLVQDSAPNAFAAGRSPETAYVAATSGLLEQLDERELLGVMAHEIAHVRNLDVRLMSLAAVMVGVIALATDMLMRAAWYGGGSRREGSGGMIAIVIGLLAAILAPLVASMLQMALSRRREYLADATAVEITGDPIGLAQALEKLRDDSQPLRKVTRATAHMYIESPLRDHHGLRSSLGGMFDTHPPLEDRIARLRTLAGEA